ISPSRSRTSVSTFPMRLFSDHLLGAGDLGTRGAVAAVEAVAVSGHRGQRGHRGRLLRLAPDGIAVRSGQAPYRGVRRTGLVSVILEVAAAQPAQRDQVVGRVQPVAPYRVQEPGGLRWQPDRDRRPDPGPLPFPD